MIPHVDNVVRALQVERDRVKNLTAYVPGDDDGARVRRAIGAVAVREASTAIRSGNTARMHRALDFLKRCR